MQIVSALISVYLLILLARVVMEYVLALSSYRPSGGIAALFELVYSATDPPLKALRRVIPPLRVGRTSIDLSILVLSLGLVIVRSALTT